jgi:hypothetical protein
MSSKQFTTTKTGAITCAMDAEILELQVTVDPSVRIAIAEITGPADVIDKIQATMNGSTWKLSFPRTGRGGGGNVSIIQTGRGVSSVIRGGTFHGSIIQSSGRVVVNGVDVTDYVNAGQPEPLRAAVRLPANSSLLAQVDAGVVTVTGTADRVDAESVSADISVGDVREFHARAISGDISADRVFGSASVRTTSGDIELTTAGRVDADAVSGDIQVHCVAPVTVSAHAVSGDVRVTANPGVRPDVRARSVSGRVRTC